MRRRPFDDSVTADILAFLKTIPIAVEIGSIAGPMFMPGMAAHRGVLRIDPEALAWPGDLLHEAGHIAVSDPASRATAEHVSGEPGEEMAAIAWSYAAARAIGVDPRLVFHAGGYRGAGASIVENFESGRSFGVPLLVWFGMTDEGTYPKMQRWLR